MRRSSRGWGSAVFGESYIPWAKTVPNCAFINHSLNSQACKAIEASLKCKTSISYEIDKQTCEIEIDKASLSIWQFYEIGKWTSEPVKL